VFHFGTPGIDSAKDDADADKILKRKSKTSNLHGAEKLGLKAFGGTGSYDAVLVVGGGRAQVPAGLKGSVVGFGVFEAADAAGFQVVLPGLSYAEKSGTVTNFEGREQKLMKSIDPRGASKSLTEVVKLWT
jgi:NADH dehydrogenase/NADH:ubiquinone oxidoreductase subunit G